mmetsp:Transcript_4725/g.10641  ORF Transcript_4725/g.10641 Transcript_4725/m.10641 type:complete len:418 (-) Transcript_4725:781-2034(-)
MIIKTPACADSSRVWLPLCGVPLLLPLCSPLYVLCSPLVVLPVHLDHDARDVVDHGRQLLPPAACEATQAVGRLQRVPVDRLGCEAVHHLHRVVVIHHVPHPVRRQDEEVVVVIDHALHALGLRRHAALVHDAVSQRSTHRQPQRLPAVLVPHAARTHRHAHGTAARLVDQRLSAAQVAPAAQNALALVSPLGLVVLGQRHRVDRPVRVAPAQHRARVPAVVHRQLAPDQRRQHARGSAAARVEVAGRVQVVLHHAEGAVHVHARSLYELRKRLPRAPRDQVPVLAVPVQHAVEADVAALEVLLDEEVVLVRPVGVVGLQAADRGAARVVVLLRVEQHAASQVLATQGRAQTRTPTRYALRRRQPLPPTAPIGCAQVHLPLLTSADVPDSRRQQLPAPRTATRPYLREQLALLLVRR